MKKTYTLRFFLCFCIFIAVQCTKTEQVPATASTLEDEIVITVESDSVVIRWDDPSVDADSVTSYELYYHTVADKAWKLLRDKIPVTRPAQVKIYRNEIVSSDSIFYFGTVSVAKNGKKSDIHSSQDSSAEPPDWVLHWSSKKG